MKQLLSQKLSPQQIQFIKLLQIPTAELEARIKEELEVNPALEEGEDEPEDEFDDLEGDDADDDFDDPDAELDNPDNTLDEDFDGEQSEEQPEMELPVKEEPAEAPESSSESDDLDLSDYLNDDEIAGYKMQGDGPGEDEDDREMPLADTSGSLMDNLLSQLVFPASMKSRKPSAASSSAPLTGRLHPPRPVGHCQRPGFLPEPGSHGARD